MVGFLLENRQSDIIIILNVYGTECPAGLCVYILMCLAKIFFLS